MLSSLLEDMNKGTIALVTQSHRGSWRASLPTSIPTFSSKSQHTQRRHRMSNDTNAQQQSPQPPQPRRVRIVNNGGPGYATQITDANTGQHISNVFHIRLVDIDVKDVPRAILWTHMPVVDVIANAEVVECCLYCGQQKPGANQQGGEYRVKI